MIMRINNDVEVEHSPSPGGVAGIIERFNILRKSLSSRLSNFLKYAPLIHPGMFTRVLSFDSQNLLLLSGILTAIEIETRDHKFNSFCYTLLLMMMCYTVILRAIYSILFESSLFSVLFCSERTTRHNCLHSYQAQFKAPVSWLRCTHNIYT